MMLNAAGSCSSMLWLTMIGVGFLLLPASLKKLSGGEKLAVREG